MTRPAVLPERFDALGLATADDPYERYRAIRDAGAVCRGGPGQWLVGRHAEVAALLRDRRLGQFQFSDAYRMFPGASLTDTLRDGPAARFTRRIVAGRDRPEHTRLRRLLAPVADARAVAALRGPIEDEIDRAVACARAAGGMDAVADLAVPVPLRVLGTVLGLPAAEQEEFGRRALVLARMFAAVIPGETMAECDDAVSWLRDRVAALVRRVRGGSAPASAGPFAALLDAAGPLDGEAGEELVDNVVFLFFAGFETSVNLLASACAVLAARPAQLARVRADPALAASAVEEVLRLDAPTQITGRIALEPVRVGEVTVRPGRVILLMIAAANHDERVFADPDGVDVGRDPNPHLSFGAGVHYCLGSALARAEATVLVERLAGEPVTPAGAPVREPGATLRAYTRVPLRWGPATVTPHLPAAPPVEEHPA